MGDNNIKDMLQNLAEAFKAADAAMCADVISAANSRYKQGSLDPESFAYLVIYDVLDRAKRELVAAYFPEVEDNRRLQNFIENYLLMEDMLKKMMVAVYGTPACSADNARWVLRSYYAFCTEGKLPEMEEGRGAYFKPDFGTAEDWMYLCDAMALLYQGAPTEFITTYANLLLKGREKKENKAETKE